MAWSISVYSTVLGFDLTDETTQETQTGLNAQGKQDKMLIN
jgi:hypothetical protein